MSLRQDLKKKATPEADARVWVRRDDRQTRGILRARAGGIFALAARMRVETSIGRAAALSLHPVLAWRVLRPSGRAAIVAAYFGAAYLGVLAALLTLR